MKSSAAILLVFVMVAIGCRQRGELQEEPPDLSGRVAGVALRPNGSVYLELEDVTGPIVRPGWVPPRAGIIIDSETTVFLRRATRLKQVPPEEICVGDMVEVWSYGAELRSLPPQFHARQIIIVHQ